jgi:WD40 repeat protein/mono/diheme cytochrome c family protein
MSMNPVRLLAFRASLALGLGLSFCPLYDVQAQAEKPKPASEAAKTTYADHVRAVFREHCVNCHNQNKKQNDLALDTYESTMAGGASGAAIEPGDADSSYLWALVTHKDTPHMPPNADKLPDAKLDVIKQWITGGALKDSGSKAVAKKQPTVDLSVAAGPAKPTGPVIMPEGLPRQPVVTTGRAAAITAIAASPWAPVVAIAGQKQVSLYHTDSAQLLGILPFPEGIPQVLRFSRSGALLVVGGGRSAVQGLVAVFDVRTGKRVLQVGDELDTVLAADINESQTRIALGGPQRLVRVFLTADGSLAYEIKKHTDWVYAVEFSPDGVLLATADRAGGVSLWEAESGREYLTLEGHKEAVTGLSWRSDSNVLATCSQDGTIRFWNAEDGKPLRTINAHPGGVTAVAFTHDGRLTSCGRDKAVNVWDPAGKPLRALPPMADIALKVAFTHDGGRVAAGDWTGEVRLWSAADGKEVARLPANPKP